ncbi:caspase domain-containing protein [Armillaria borealis]|uniref:Caspase domain-containing protein n=1 Tax=Armillaria borealis TaxID=47425 RepID=A0AA39JAE1_9AGAR|nr:caspase domain-containing protein [Armillaria borealis]
MISLLEQYERRLATEYGMTVGAAAEVDSVAVLQEARARAIHKKDGSSLNAYQSLHQLYHIRLQFQYKLIKPQKIASNIELPLGVERSKFWAVIIGIDAYDSYPLRGCVSDALLVEEYLKQDLGVPQEQIQLLLGSEHASTTDPSLPTRVNIVKTLLGLVSNPLICNGDNIIIYFSGHGSSYSSGDYFDSSDETDESPRAVDGSNIEAICPIDRDAVDSCGLPVPDISDREINAILHQISHSKGHRITFILDCCHSGTHTRHFPDPGTRTIPPLPRASLRRMLHAADESCGQYPSYQPVSARDWRPDMSSHVVLAACKEYQTAKEVESEAGYNGVFTQGLISTLRSESLSEESTYVDLLFSLPRRRGQTPIIAGKHKRERLWYKN